MGGIGHLLLCILYILYIHVQIALLNSSKFVIPNGGI
jgi:hypothetical protein